jgi:RNA polymerase sigma-70 factor, ECF subfamily
VSEHGVGSLAYPRVVGWGEERDGRADASDVRDPRAFVTEHYLVLCRPLTSYLKRRLGSATDAEELTQDVFLRLYVHVRAGHVVTNVRAWTFAVARHLIVDARRRGHGNPIWASAAPDDIACPAETIDRFLDRMDRRATVEAAIAALPTLQRQCLAMRAEGLRLKEIAAALDCTISTVASSLQRAVVNVRRRIEDEQTAPARSPQR